MKLSFFATMLAVGLAATCNAATLRFDFGHSSRAASENYNHVGVDQQTLFNTFDVTGALTGIGLATDGFNRAGDNNAGTTNPTGAAAIFATADGLATRDNLFGHMNPFNEGDITRPLATLTFSGLDGSGATSYDFTFFASRMGGTAVRETEYSVAGANSGVTYLDAANNVSNVALVNGITPTAAGEIVVSMTAGPNNSGTAEEFYYLGVLQLDSSSAVIPEPTTACLALVSLTVMIGSRRRK